MAPDPTNSTSSRLISSRLQAEGLFVPSRTLIVPGEAACALSDQERAKFGLKEPTTEAKASPLWATHQRREYAQAEVVRQSEGDDKKSELRRLRCLHMGLEIGLQELPSERIGGLLLERGHEAAWSEVVEEGLRLSFEAILSQTRYGKISEEVQAFGEQAQARWIAAHRGDRFPRLAADDRLADNSELVLGLFEYRSPVLLPPGVNQWPLRMSEYQRFTQDRANSSVVSLLVRVEREFLRTFFYYGNIRSWEELRSFTAVEEKYRPSQERKKGETDVGIADALSRITAHHIEELAKLVRPANGTELGELIFEPNRRRYLQHFNPEFNRYLCEELPRASGQELLQAFSAVGGLFNSRGTFSYDDDGHDESVKVALPNCAAVGRYLKFVAISDFTELLQNAEVVTALQRIPNSNMPILLSAINPRDERELIDALSHPTLNRNAITTELSSLPSLLSACGLSAEPARRLALQVFCESWNKQMAQTSAALAQKIASLPSEAMKREDLLNFGATLARVLAEPSHAEQNLRVLNRLVEGAIPSPIEITRFEELRAKMRGALTPVLASRYVKLGTLEERQELLASYRAQMRQVLGGGSVQIRDPEFVAEIIYLAYRPYGYTVERIASDLANGNVSDYTAQVATHRFAGMTFPFQLQKVERTQAASFDSVALNALEMQLLRSPRSTVLELVRNAFSAKPAHSDARLKLSGLVLSGMKDYRVAGYRDDYFEGKEYSDRFTEQRLTRLGEILRVLPGEEKFKEVLSGLIDSSPEVARAARSAVEQSLWFERKGRMSAGAREAKGALDQVIRRVETTHADELVDLSAAERACISSGVILDGAHKSRELEATLVAHRWERFLGAPWSHEVVAAKYLELLQAVAHEGLKLTRRELKKVEAKQTGELVHGTACISKNVGSFYAKAGAELCTAEDLGMWAEARHFHLNLDVDDQIIGNVMVYIEPERSYLVARGFNPRNDALQMYDRRWIAREMVRLVEEVARSEGLREVFITEQGSFFALSNREGIAKDVLEIARHNQQKAQKINPAQRIVIEDADFAVRGLLDGVNYSRLILLSLVE
jgi:hypothetical protein